MERPDTASPPLATWLLTVLALTLALAVFVGTDRWFSVLEDETAIVVAARSPLAETAELFWSGQGQHEHPPLSDILLHTWLPVGGAAQWSLRLPSVVFYLAGLVFLALAARKIGGASAFTALLAMGLLSPFGFHFGRLIGWYSFCFFLVAVVTWTYLRYTERPTTSSLS
jgi:4-amino-4-deoxy-L-arabinose transferase-like glycosyltransferase